MNRSIARLVLASCTVLLLVGALELGLSVTRYDLNPSPYWRFHPDFGWTSDPAGVSADLLQPDGFRYDPNPEHLRGVPEDRVKTLVVLGDSFTAALNLPYAETFPGLLESGLAQSGQPWRVIALACDDWGQAQQLLALRGPGLAAGPDAIVLQTFPLNDFCNNTRILAGTCSLQDSHRPYFVPENGGLTLTWNEPASAGFRRRLRLFGVAENALRTLPGQLPKDWMPDESDQDLRRREYFRHRARLAGLEHEGVVYSLLPPPHQPPAIAEGWEGSRRMALEFGKMAVDRGIPLVVLVIPFLKTFEPGWQELQEVFPATIQRDYDTCTFEHFFRAAGARVISVRQRIEAAGRPPQDYFISPTDGHLSHFGHRACSEWLLDALSEP